MKRSWLSIYIFASTAAIAAAVVPSDCRLSPRSGLVTSAEVKEADAGYYQQVLGSGKLFAFGFDNGSGLYDLRNGKLMRFRFFDGFPTPDEKLLISPANHFVQTRSELDHMPLASMQFFTMESAVKLGDRAKPIYVNPLQKGFYQSVALVSKSARRAIYRVFASQGQGTIEDYEAKFSLSGKVVSIRAIQPKPIVICEKERKAGRFDMSSSLPILSKDGSELASLDNLSHTTKIYKIDSKTGSCTEEEDLGISTGKVSFNSDGSKVVFHAIDFNPISHAQVHASTGSGIFVLDRKTRAITALTHADETFGRSPDFPGEATLNIYPSFTKEGNVAYLQISAKGSGHHERLIVVDPSQLRSVTPTPDRCVPQGAEFDSVIALSGVWQEACGNQKNLASSDRFVSLQMTPEICKKLVKDHWNRSLKSWLIQNGYLTAHSKLGSDLTEKVLSAACTR